MADLVTLDTLFPADPAAADNSGGESAGTGATTAQASSPPASPDYSQRIADLEGLVQRHQTEQQRWRDQVTGSQRENERLRAEIQEIRTRLATTSQAPAPAPPARRVSLVEANEKFLLDNDKSLLQEYERQQAELAQAPKPSVTIDDVRGLLAETEQKRETRTRAEQTRLTLEQTLTSRHPELNNPAQHPAFVNALGVRYQELRSDPVTHVLYPPDPNAMFTDPGTGAEYDMRVLLAAASDVKAKQPTTPAPAAPTLGTHGAPAPTTHKGPVLPRNLVEGPNAVLADPAIQKALANIGWGGTTKEMATKLLQHTDAAAKARWQRGEVV
jgi:hypothetical protein